MNIYCDEEQAYGQHFRCRQGCHKRAVYDGRTLHDGWRICQRFSHTVVLCPSCSRAFAGVMPKEETSHEQA